MGGRHGREGLVGRDVLPVEAQVLRREGLAIRPAMPLAQAKGEDAPFLDGEIGEQVRLELQRLIEADQPGKAEDVEQPRVPGPADQRAEIPAAPAQLRDVAQHPGLVGKPGKNAWRHRRAKEEAQAEGQGREHLPVPDHSLTRTRCLGSQAISLPGPPSRR
jgi:hypothetical protein